MGRKESQWWDKSWNPVTGCTPVSEGCEHCYARAQHERFERGRRCAACGGIGGDCDAGDDGRTISWPCDVCFGGGRIGATHSWEDVTTHPERLADPCRWHKPKRIFVCSMGDLFHKDVPTHVLHDALATCGSARQHKFLILTKRPERMRDLLTSDYFPNGFHEDYGPLQSRFWPLPNLWLGVTAENQARFDERWPILADTPAAVKFVSYEPGLGPLDASRALGVVPGHGPGKCLPWTEHVRKRSGTCPDWVICGAETGPGARPMDLAWARDLRDQCRAAGVPFWFKKAGPGKTPIPDDLMIREYPKGNAR